MIKNVFFDLDQTLLHFDVDMFLYRFVKEMEIFFNNEGYYGKSISKIVVDGTLKMLKNDGSMTNEEVMIDYLSKNINIDMHLFKSLITKYYQTNYDNLKNLFIYKEESVEIIKVLKDKGYNLYLTTNPLFPNIATTKRMKYNDLNPSDFKIITTYENSSYCKPNLNYYIEVINKFNLDKDTILMIGNDVSEDLVIEKLGIPCFLVTDQLFNKNNLDYSNTYKIGSRKELLKYVKSLPAIN